MKNRFVINCGRHQGRSYAYRISDEGRQLMKITHVKEGLLNRAGDNK